MDRIDAETASAGEDNDDDGTASVVNQVVANVEKNLTSSHMKSEAMPETSRPTINIDIQEPFQPGSTPIHLQSRFMVWNTVGIVKAFTSEEEKSIDVEFHDTAVHHPIHLSNANGYSMAALSDKCLILACEGDDEGESMDDDDTTNAASKFLCHYFGSSDINKEWSLEMPNQEEIMAITCGDGWVSQLKLNVIS